MKINIIIATLVVIIGGILTFGHISSQKEGDSTDVVKDETESLIEQQLKTPELIPEISWNLLYKYDYQNSTGPDDLMALDGKLVKIPGYIVPLTDDYTQLDEFLLVPDAQSCIHVPPPPPNLIVAVTLREPVPMEEVYNPSWIYGIFKIEESYSIHGGSSYKMDAVKIEKFVYEY